MPHETFDQDDLQDPTPDAAGSGGFDPRNEHPEYAGNKKAWETTRDVYLGADGILPNAERYVPQRERGEADESYEERKSLLHVSGLLGTVIDALVGLWARKPPDIDTWGTLAGDVGEEEEPGKDSLAAQIIDDADRNRTSWDNHRRARATWMLVFRKAYTLIDTNKPTSEEITREEANAMNVRPFVTLITPLDVLDWITEDGRKVEAVIREKTDTRSSLDEGSGEEVERYLRLQLDGWSRWEVVEKGESTDVTQVGSGTYEYHDSDGKRRLPLVEATLPLPRYITYNLARIVLAIINHDSHLDSLNRAGALGQYLAVQGDEEEIRKNLKVGDKILPYPPGAEPPAFVAYEMAAASHLEDRIDSLVQQYWNAAMWEFSDRAAETTATEIEQEWAAGVGAFLALLAGAMQEAENDEKMLLAQASEGPNVSDVGETTFSRDYRIEDVVAELKRLKEMIFGAGSSLTLTPALESAIGAYFLRKLDDTTGLLSELPEDVDVNEEVEAAALEEDLERRRDRELLDEARSQPSFPEETEEEVEEAA